MTEQPAPHKHTPPNKRSFNLLLMMTLLALAGIAAYLALSHYYPATADNDTRSGDPELARFELDAQIKSLEPVVDAMENYYQNHQEWPQELAQLELDEEELQSYPSLRMEPDGQLSFSGSPALGEHQDHRIYLKAEGTPDATGVNWRCSAPGVPESYLPDYCIE